MKRSTLIFVLPALLLGACTAPEEPTVPLYAAVQRGDIEQVERHIHWDTDINAPFPGGRYPIHDAAEKGRIIMLDMLIRSGAELEVSDAAGRTALDLAVLNGRTQAAEVLLRAGAQLDASALLLEAARRGAEDRDIVRFLKSHGANLDVTDEQGNTALMIATSRGNHRLAHHLVEQGADLQVRNLAGQSALDISAERGAMEIHEFLLRNGAAIKTPQ
jgi:ankyrin repeat protein